MGAPVLHVDIGAVVRINTEAEEYLNSQASLTAEQLPPLIAMAALFNVACLNGAVAAFVVAVRRGKNHDDPNYRWFAARYPEFLYVDRIIVAAAARGKGLGSHLYKDLFSVARRLQAQRVTCEIDCDPPNEPSLRLHERFGFRETGRHAVDGGKKMVSLQVAQLDGP